MLDEEGVLFKGELDATFAIMKFEVFKDCLGALVEVTCEKPIFYRLAQEIIFMRLSKLSKKLLSYEYSVQKDYFHCKHHDEFGLNGFCDLLSDVEYQAYFVKKFPVWYELSKKTILQTRAFIAKVIWDLESLEIQSEKLKQISIIDSDPHSNGQVNLLIELLTNQRWVYKPRSMQMDFSFQEYLRLNNQILGQDYFKTAQVRIKKGNECGIIEFVEKQSLTRLSKDEVSCYFEKLGALVATVFVLAGVDFHHENIISTKDGPLLIDLEGLLQPKLDLNRSEHSIFSTGLLPGVIPGSKELSGVGSSWEYLINGYEEYSIDLIRGFEQQYRMQLVNRCKLVNSKAYQDLTCSSTRLLFANTHDYLVNIDKLIEPKALACIEYRGNLLNQLVVYNALGEVDPVLGFEKMDLDNLDVPIFWYDPKANKVISSNKSDVPISVLHSGAEVSYFRLFHKMSQNDLIRQKWYLSLSLESYFKSKSDVTNYTLDHDLRIEAHFTFSQVLNIISQLCWDHTNGAFIFLAPEKIGNRWMISEIKGDYRELLIKYVSWMMRLHSIIRSNGFGAQSVRGWRQEALSLLDQWLDMVKLRNNDFYSLHLRNLQNELNCSHIKLMKLDQSLKQIRFAAVEYIKTQQMIEQVRFVTPLLDLSVGLCFYGFILCLSELFDQSREVTWNINDE